MNRHAVSEQGLVLEGKSLLPSLPCAHRRVHTDGVQVVDVEELDPSKAERDELAKAFFWSTSTQSYVAVVLISLVPRPRTASDGKLGEAWVTRLVLTELEGCESSDVHLPPLPLCTYTHPLHRGYDEVGWSECLSRPPVPPPHPTLGKYPDPVSQKLTFRRYNSAPAEWQVRAV